MEQMEDKVYYAAQFGVYSSSSMMNYSFLLDMGMWKGWGVPSSKRNLYLAFRQVRAG